MLRRRGGFKTTQDSRRLQNHFKTTQGLKIENHTQMRDYTKNSASLPLPHCVFGHRYTHKTSFFANFDFRYSFNCQAGDSEMAV